MNPVRIKAFKLQTPGDHETRWKKKNLATKESGGRCQVEINVLEHDTSEKKNGGRELMVDRQLRGDAGVALESTWAAPWSAAHSI